MSSVFGKLISSTQKVATPESVDKLLRALCFQTAGNMAYRIHTEGKKADGTLIGVYKPKYMKVRTGQWKYRGRKLNRTADTKMIFSLTREMENDFSLSINDPIKTPNGYGIGFKNSANAKKAGFLEERFPGTYKVSKGEAEGIQRTTDDFIKNAYQVR